LLRRTTRSLVLTPPGEVFYRHASSVLESISRAEESVRSSEPVMRGDLRVSVPPIVSDSFSQLVVEFALRYPEVRVHVDFSTRHVDLVREGYDVALRATSKLGPGLIARTVARHKMLAVASPEYLARNGTPKTLKDLARHRCLSGFARGELAESTWKAKRGTVRIDPAFSSNQLSLLRDAVLGGAGIAVLPEPLVATALRQGELVRVLPYSLESENSVSVVYVERDLLPAHVRAFVDVLVTWAQAAMGRDDLVPPPPRRKR
jgi:DNA-binding transcriptional LysR family regulator